MTDIHIVATCGLPGSGKTVVSKYLISKGYYRIYFGDVTFDEMKRLKLEVNEKNERSTRERIRKENGGIGAYAKFIIPKIKEAIKNGETKILLESLYSWEEYTAVKEEYPNNFFVIATITPFDIRAERMEKRFDERPLTREQTKSRDYAQIEKLHQAGPITYADFPIINITTIEHIHSEIDKALKKIENGKN